MRWTAAGIAADVSILGRTRVLLIAEAANPEWASVPLVGWSHCEALAKRVDAHVVTQTRNRDAIVRAGWREQVEFTALDSEAAARPLWRADRVIRAATGLGWTLTTALAALPYYYFEHLVWQRFGARIRSGEFGIVHRITPLSPTIPSLLAARCRDAGAHFVWGPINGGVPWPKEFAGIQRQEGEWLSHVRSAYKLLPAYRSTREDASAILVGSRDTWNDLPARIHEKCVYVPENAVDPARFAPAHLASAVRGPVGRPLRVAFVGRLVPYKGADMLIEACAPMIRSGEIALDIIGDGPEMPRLRRLAEELDVIRGVSLDGWIEHTRLQARLGASDVFAFPSVREFGGGVVLEAMALGLVPVVVDYGGPGELVTESTGFRIPMAGRAELVERFRTCLGALAAHPERIREVGDRARARVFASFTWSAKAEQTCAIYRWILGEGPKPDFGVPFGEAPTLPRAVSSRDSSVQKDR